MKVLTFVFQLIANTVIGLWNMLAALINLVDGGDDDEMDDTPRHVTRYNHHTGETDRTRYPDGVYSDDRIDRGISDP